MVGEFEPDGAHYVTRFWVDSQPPEILPVLIGDFLTNLRAVLDHLITHLSMRDGKCPNDISWPFCGSPKEFDRRKPNSDQWDKTSGMYRIRRIDSVYQAHVRALQPYIAQEPNATLKLLNRLCNSDKHRSIRTVAVMPWGVGYTYDPPLPTTPDIESFPGPYEHNAKVSRISITRNPDVENPVKGNVGALVAFHEPASPMTMVGPMLQQMLGVVRDDVLGRFGARFQDLSDA